MTDVFEINDNLLAALHLQAVTECGRTEYDLCMMPEEKGRRMLIALEAEARVPVHRHLKLPETMLCLEGCLDVVFYDLRPNDDCGGPFMGDCGTVIAEGMETNVFDQYRVRLCPREGRYGVQVPPGVWHSVQVHEPSTVFLVRDKRPEP